MWVYGALLQLASLVGAGPRLRRRAPGVHMCLHVRQACHATRERHYTRHHDARSAPRRLEPGGMAPTRRETGASRAQTALTDTPAIYTTAPPPVSALAALDA